MYLGLLAWGPIPTDCPRKCLALAPREILSSRFSDVPVKCASCARSRNSSAMAPMLFSRAPTTAMAKGYGSFSGGATLERKKVTVRQKQKSQEPKLDQGGGSGGIGKILFNGGGGDDDGGDDDDYFKQPGGDGDEPVPRPLQVAALELCVMWPCCCCLLLLLLLLLCLMLHSALCHSASL